MQSASSSFHEAVAAARLLSETLSDEQAETEATSSGPRPEAHEPWAQALGPYGPWAHGPWAHGSRVGKQFGRQIILWNMVGPAYAETSVGVWDPGPMSLQTH